MDSVKDLPPKVKDVINSTSDMVPKAASLKEANEGFHKKHQSSLPHDLSYLRSRQMLDPSSKSQNEKDLITAINNSKFSLEDAVLTITTLKEWGSTDSVVEELKAALRKKWPEATVLASR